MKTNINAPTNGEQSTDGHLEENHLEVQVFSQPLRWQLETRAQ